MTIDNQAVENASIRGDEVPVLRGAVEEPPMEGLTHLVTESLARNGYETSLDPRRLQWSKWFRCESSFSVLLAPSKPGLFALGEEIIAPGESGGKRMLALFRIAEADDLGMALGHLFLPGNPEREKLSTGHCFVRYAVIEDALQRQSAQAALQQWMAASSEPASGEFTTHNFPSTNQQEVKTEEDTVNSEAENPAA